MSDESSNLPDLTDKQRVFVAEYLDCLNATEAARRAKYAHPNKQGPALLVNLGIRSAIDAGLRERTLSKDEVLGRLTAQARGDMSDFLRVDEEEITLTWSLMALPKDGDGEADEVGATLKLAMQGRVGPTDRVLHTATIKRAVARLDLLTAGQAGKLGLVKKYATDKDGKVSIELYDAKSALDTLAKIYGLLKDGGGVLLNVTADQLKQMGDEDLQELARKRGLL